MLQLIQRNLWLIVLLTGIPLARGYALLGPLTGEAWQTANLGYQLGQDVGTPKNIGEGYRRNTPFLYYSYDANFSGYFGSNGEASVDSAIAIMNSIQPVDTYSPGLYEVPMNTQIMDDTAYALGLTDLKSFTLPFLVEQLGLAQPERYTWTLHAALNSGPAPCPTDYIYLVVQRNFDPITSGLQQVQYSPYVNGTLYYYTIQPNCPANTFVAVPSANPPDFFDPSFTAVAGLNQGLGVDSGTSVTNGPWNAISVGGVYQGLTRDDVGGYRYLYSTNNVVYERPDTGAVLDLVTTNVGSVSLFPATQVSSLVTNFTTLTNITALTNIFGPNGLGGYFYTYDGTYGYGSYGQLVTLAQYLPATALEALYPGLVANQITNWYVLTNAVTVNYYFTNYPGSIYGKNPSIVAYTTTNWYILQLYSNTFANVFVNKQLSTNWAYTLVTNTVGPQPGKIWGTIYTNTTVGNFVVTNEPTADFFVLPLFQSYTNVCPLDLAYTIQTNVWYFTNQINLSSVSNTTVQATGTNVNNLTYSSTVYQVGVFTNYTWVQYQVTCAQATNGSSGWYQGIGHVQFVREPDTDLVDPLTDLYVTSFTNTYPMVNYNPTNNSFGTQYFTRIVTQPDVLFDAVDMAGLPNANGGLYVRRNLTFDAADALPGLAGPGTIDTPTRITYNKVGNIYGNGSIAQNQANLSALGYLSQYSAVPLTAWASFDGSTNPPVVYPNGTSIQAIENELIINVTPAALNASGGSNIPSSTNSQPYSVTFTGTGGIAPYTWALAPGSTVPAGLALTYTPTNATLGGTVSAGATAGVYDFTLQLTDSANRIVYFTGYSITNSLR